MNSKLSPSDSPSPSCSPRDQNLIISMVFSTLIIRLSLLFMSSSHYINSHGISYQGEGEEGGKDYIKNIEFSFVAAVATVVFSVTFPGHRNTAAVSTTELTVFTGNVQASSLICRKKSE